jgi:phosphoglycerate kinase
MNKLSQLDINNKNLVIRVDMNVPIIDGRVADDTRIQACLPTIKKSLNSGAKILLVSHLGRPVEGSFDNNLSLRPVADHLSKILDLKVGLISEPSNSSIFNGSSDVQMLENV